MKKERTIDIKARELQIIFYQKKIYIYIYIQIIKKD